MYNPTLQLYLTLALPFPSQNLLIFWPKDSCQQLWSQNGASWKEIKSQAAFLKDDFCMLKKEEENNYKLAVK